MKKKVVTICLVACLFLVAITGATLAYFTDNEKATNTFVVGKVDIELTETKWTDQQMVVPGVAYEKNPVVKNVGKNPAWIRVDVTLSDATAFGAAATDHNITELDTIFKMVTDFENKWISAGVTQPTTGNDTLTYSYYYKTMLDVNADTGALFETVTIPSVFNNADMEAIGEDFTITVTAHAIQDADGFDSVQDAFAGYVVEP